jgi:small subunit ribosomal protein S21
MSGQNAKLTGRNQSVRGLLFIDFARKKPIFNLSYDLFAGTASAVFTRPRKEVSTLTEIKLKKGEPVDRALRRLKKKVDREGTLKVVRSRRQFEKPSERRRRKEKVARFSAMLAARHADD